MDSFKILYLATSPSKIFFNIVFQRLRQQIQLQIQIQLKKGGKIETNVEMLTRQSLGIDWIYFTPEVLVDFLTISRITKTYTKTIPGLHRGPPQDEGWDEDEQTKSENESKR